MKNSLGSLALFLAVIALCMFTYRRDMPYEVFAGFTVIMLLLLDKNDV